MDAWIITWKIVLFLACIFYFGVAALVALNGGRDIADALGIRRSEDGGAKPEQ